MLGGDILLYHGTPATGTLFLAISQAGGTDEYGNVYDAGISLIDDVTTDDVVAQITSEFSQYGGGFWSRGFQAPVPIYAQLQGGLLRFNTVDDDAFSEGHVQWTASAANNSTQMILSSGRYRTTDSPAWIELHPESDLRARPLVKVKDNGAGAVDMSVSGDLAVSDLLTLGGVDQGKGIVGSITQTTNVTFGGTETAIMTTPSITFEDGRAYRVRVFGQHQWPTTDNYAFYRVRKGGVAGALYKNQLRTKGLPIPNLNTPVFLELNFTNTSGADVSTALCLTGQQGSVAQTWTWSCGPSDNISYMTVEDIGLAADWPGQAIT